MGDVRDQIQNEKEGTAKADRHVSYRSLFIFFRALPVSQDCLEKMEWKEKRYARALCVWKYTVTGATCF